MRQVKKCIDYKGNSCWSEGHLMPKWVPKEKDFILCDHCAVHSQDSKYLKNVKARPPHTPPELHQHSPTTCSANGRSFKHYYNKLHLRKTISVFLWLISCFMSQLSWQSAPFFLLELNSTVVWIPLVPYIWEIPGWNIDLAITLDEKIIFIFCHTT
jgi:hypothetical protein